MSNEFNELISAYFDGELDELSRQRLIKAMRDDPELKAQWDRYSLISDGMRSRLHAQPLHCLSARVSAALEDEPVDQTLKSTNVSTRTFKAAGGLAIAASVAMIALVGLNNVPVSDSTEASLAQIEVSPPKIQNANIARVNAHNSVRWNRMQPATEKRLNAYLLKHYEYAPSSGVSVILPYANIVGYQGKESTE